MQLAIHGNDPLYSVLRLPCILGTEKGFTRLAGAVPNSFHGLCLCMGTLGLCAADDIPAIVWGLLNCLGTTNDPRDMPFALRHLLFRKCNSFVRRLNSSVYEFFLWVLFFYSIFSAILFLFCIFVKICDDGGT
ncbi:MAG: mannonate dehydratase [Candidatus Azobacteroides sp.]|nr:mannonate dehydratase [Candidatus Azobacteroides sp.]